MYLPFTPFVGYRYWFSQRFGLGGTFAFDVNSVKLYNGNNTAEQMQKINRYYMTVAVEPTLNYISRASWQLYGYFGFGGTIVMFSKAAFGDETASISHKPYINVHITPIGLRFGKQFSGFVEVGYGYKGIVNVGLSYRFWRKPTRYCDICPPEELEWATERTGSPR
jgi:hypothetical protein